MTNQQWSSSHKNPNISLSNGNLTATNTSDSADNHRVFAAIGKTTGKYYWEFAVTIASGSGSGYGVGNTSSDTSDGYWLGLNAETISWFPSGAVDNNANTVATWATFASGAIICFALDLTNYLIWGRVGAGNWNDSPTANPASGTGGLTIPSDVYALPVVPGLSITTVGTPSDAVTAAFAAGSWTYSAPSGFKSFDTSVEMTVNAVMKKLVASFGDLVLTEERTHKILRENRSHSVATEARIKHVQGRSRYHVVPKQ